MRAYLVSKKVDRLVRSIDCNVRVGLPEAIDPFPFRNHTKFDAMRESRGAESISDAELCPLAQDDSPHRDPA